MPEEPQNHTDLHLLSVNLELLAQCLRTIQIAVVELHHSNRDFRVRLDRLENVDDQG